MWPAQQHSKNQSVNIMTTVQISRPTIDPFIHAVINYNSVRRNHMWKLSFKSEIVSEFDGWMYP